MKNNLDTEQNSVKNRLIDFLKYKEISQSKFEQLCGISNGYVNNIRKGIKSEMFDKKIAPIFPELSKTWLLLGEGSMLIPQTEEFVPEEEEESYLRTERNKYGLSLQDIHEHTQISVKDLSLYDSREKEMPKKVRRILEGFFERVEMEYENKDEDEERERTEIPILQTEMMLSSVKVPYYDVDFAGGWTSYELSTQTTPTFIISSPDFARAEFAC
ncbi:TPA: hypothetical protein WM899_001901, partial [Neisseria gonorrhoeae]